tara:strand:+ start:280 stop:495 length:216 start_codon:yes stop_codon:yes gene_type:complete
MFKSLVAQVQEYALENYTVDAWDVIVETYTDEELAELLADANTLDEAIQILTPLMSVWLEQQAEAEYQRKA